MHLTPDTWAVVASTLGAAFLGGILTYIGSALQQRRQAKHDAKIRREQAAREARIRLEQNVAELLAAAQDLVIGVQAIRQAHQRRTLPRYYFRAIAGLFLAVPELTSLRVLGELDTLKSLTRTALDLDRNQMDVTRMITLDTATVVAAKGNRYLAVAALLTLGQDKEITAAVRALTSKVTGLMEGIGARKREFERLRNELQEAMEDFRDLADKRLGNVRKA